MSEPIPSPRGDLNLLVGAVLDYAIFMLDPSGVVVSWNAGAEKIKGYRAEEIIGRHFSVFYPPEDVAADKPGRELADAVTHGRLEDEGWRLRQDGSRFWANVVITALFGDAGELRGFAKVTRDMTERRAAQRERTEHRRLLRHLVEAQEMERRRIAWDVHDDSIQAMVAVGIRLQLLAKQVPADQSATLLALSESVRTAIFRLRNLVFRLQPPGIEREGLSRALTGYVRQVQTETGVEHVVHDNLDYEPPHDRAITAFRICQEALTNVRKHAEAHRVDIRLDCVDDGILVRVDDDGVGLADAADRASGRDHFGVIEMRERAEIAGGWWTIRRGPDAGTTVEFWLPAPRSAAERRSP